MEGISIYQVDDGKIIHEWAQPDIMSMMQQLGVAPSPQEMG
ncbi:MAG: ester cyclase [Candidatus Marinimicrobia bacterium]|nr:ester cyclase [Candidatus Neomarinimicrobiota bacterium]MCF7827937.1 ester cyclase [Candidatus Neomarinimicrobiota bacterium]MCF7879308.1 ester cyclase [Candidatus Neomarinimicrobiota bacterium]